VTSYPLPQDVDDLVAEKGFTYRDRGLMLSALAAPMPVFGEVVYPGLHLKAAVLIIAINRNHPLLDGNKRLSWYLTVIFYALNGYDLHVDAGDGDRYIRLIAAGDESLQDVELWLDNHTDRLA